MRTAAIILFDHVEVLDFAGPFEVFSVCGLRNLTEAPFEVFTVAQKSTITARNDLQIIPTYTFDNCPHIDLMIIPSGGGRDSQGRPYGSRKEMENEVLLNWIIEKNNTLELLLSVCTGSLILARTRLLDGLKATTHRMAVDQMKKVAPKTEILSDLRWVDNGHIILSAGVSAGIDMSFYVISRLLGKQTADETAKYMQYDHWK